MLRNIIQLLTSELVDMMLYKPVASDIDRGDSRGQYYLLPASITLQMYIQWFTSQ